MKRKTITLVVYMLVCMSLVSVGFAAWIITGGSETEVKGNISAVNVTDQSVSIQQLGWDEETNGNGKINFSYPELASGTAQAGWLRFDEVDTEDFEKLYATYTFRVYAAGNNLATAIDALATVDLKVIDTAIDGLQDSTPNDDSDYYYISDAIISYSISNVSAAASKTGSFTEYKDTTDKTATDIYKAALKASAESKTEIWVSVKVEYEWGNIFGGMNPYDFYNELDGTTYKRPPLGTNDQGLENSGADVTWKYHANHHLSHLFTTLGATAGKTDAFVLQIRLLGAGENSAFGN